MNTLLSMTVGVLALLTSGVALAQTGAMMDGGNPGFDWIGGYRGGIWMSLLLIVFVGALVVLVVRRGNR